MEEQKPKVSQWDIEKNWLVTIGHKCYRVRENYSFPPIEGEVNVTIWELGAGSGTSRLDSSCEEFNRIWKAVERESRGG